MAMDGEEFVQAAYELVLGREADEEGLPYYVARLNIGYSKLSVIHQLTASGEPWNRQNVPGLRRALRRYRMGRWPLIGWMLRKLWRVEGETVPERLQRTIISELAALRAQLRSGAIAAVAPGEQPSGRTTNRESDSPANRRRNLVAEQLSPRAREIFDRLVSG